MNHARQQIKRILRLATLALGLLLLAACASHGQGHGSTRYYSGSGFYHPAGAVYYPRSYAYYGRYAPGWFAAGPYFPGNYWGFGAMVYWPTYASSYYYSNHYYGGGYYGRYDPYWDPWYYGYAGYYRLSYGPWHRPWHGSWNGPYYGYGGSGYNYYRPNPGYSQSYQPPVRQEYPRDRRSATVVTQQQGMTRNTSVAPSGNGASGMVVSNRSERKVQPSRLHPVAPASPRASDAGTPGIVVAPTRPTTVTPEQRSFDAGRRSLRAPAFSSSPRNEVPPAAARQEPVYQHRLDSSSIQSRAELRQRGGDRPGRDRDRERDSDRRRQ